jgi:hypothetical protein
VSDPRPAIAQPVLFLLDVSFTTISDQEIGTPLASASEALGALMIRFAVQSTISARQLYKTVRNKGDRMKLSRGNMTPHRLFNVRDIGLGNPERHVDRVIKVFLAIGEAVAARWIQMPKAILLLQMAPENRASGAIYIYDRLRQDFYMLSFEGAEDTLTVEDFSQLLREYNLLRYVEQPGLLQPLFKSTGSA